MVGRGGVSIPPRVPLRHAAHARPTCPAATGHAAQIAPRGTCTIPEASRAAGPTDRLQRSAAAWQTLAEVLVGAGAERCAAVARAAHITDENRTTVIPSRKRSRKREVAELASAPMNTWYRTGGPAREQTG